MAKYVRMDPTAPPPRGKRIERIPPREQAAMYLAEGRVCAAQAHGLVLRLAAEIERQDLELDRLRAELARTRRRHED